jgi:hypothetical protein
MNSAVDVGGQIARAENLVDEQRILEAIRLAQDIPRVWTVATPEQRRRIVRNVMERI